MMWTQVVLFAALTGVLASQHIDTNGSRIISGWAASEGQFPYMIFVRSMNQYGNVGGCGGSIVHSRWGLTAGKCTVQAVKILISAGMVNFNRPLLTLETSTYHQAPGFLDVPISQPNDLALIGFNLDIQFNAYIQPIRLQRSADKDLDYTDVMMTTAGWGTTFMPSWSENIVMSENLNWVHQVGVGNLMCMLMLNTNYLVQASTVCARHYNHTTQSICSGDGGGPLTILDTDNRPTQIGVASFVSSWGCDIGFPAGFVRPGYYLDWMREVTGIDFDW